MKKFTFKRKIPTAPTVPPQQRQPGRPASSQPRPHTPSTAEEDHAAAVPATAGLVDSPVATSLSISAQPASLLPALSPQPAPPPRKRDKTFIAAILASSRVVVKANPATRRLLFAVVPSKLSPSSRPATPPTCRTPQPSTPPSAAEPLPPARELVPLTPPRTAPGLPETGIPALESSGPLSAPKPPELRRI
jgi:hypothetical protein